MQTSKSNNIIMRNISSYWASIASNNNIIVHKGMKNQLSREICIQKKQKWSSKD